MSTIKKILIITSEFPPQPGGIGDHAYNLAYQLSEHGYVVRVLADQRSRDGLEEQAFDASLSFEVKRTAIRSPRALMYVQRLVSLFNMIRSAEQVIATGKFSLWSVAFSSLFFKRPYMAVVHGTEVNFKTPLLRGLTNASLKRFQTIVAVSHYTKQLVAHIERTIVVIPNGFDPKKWKQTHTTDGNSLKGTSILTTVGNVTSRKGQWQVIRHLPQLLEQYPQLHYHCVGLMTEVDACKALAAELGVEAHVTFHGRVDDGVLKDMLQQTNIFIMLSSETETGDVEGFGIAILEANALGVPAIGSKGCGIEDAISEGASGVLIDASDGDALVEAVHTILNHQRVFREGALAWAESHHWSQIIHQYLKHFP